MDIKILPSNIANLIAAGEVVQRPSSVVKELMENAVDAGADRIDVVIMDAGRTLIQVVDNGCGMSPDQAVLCFERHATSKIETAEDLASISTFGFRGEALASIAAVSEVTLRTRREEDEVGCQVEYADSKHLATNRTACPKGANFAVRNLFYNVPARRKFLKSDKVELKHIVEEFTHVALTRPEVGFSLISDGREMFVLRPAKSLKFRIQDLLGSNAVDKVVDISGETSVVNVSGYVGRPDMARKTVGEQFFFVNGRYFRSPYFHKAVMKAYEGLVADGAVPSYFIYLDVDPGTMDVNIHPTKTEIKFENDPVIFQVIYATVREAIGRNSFSDAIDFDTAGAPELPVIGKSFDDYRPQSFPRMDVDPGYNPFDNTPEGEDSQTVGGFRGGDFQKYVDRREDYGKLFEDKILPTSQIIILDGKYIISKAREGLLAVNIRRARERIFYERFLSAITGNGHVSQSALFPVRVEVGAANRLVFEENRQLLESLGFDISSLGNDTIAVNGVPDGFSCESSKVEALMADVLLALSDDSSSLPGMMEGATASRFATLGAKEAKVPASPIEAQRLIDTLFMCDNHDVSPGGKKILTIITADEIGSKF